MKSSGSMSFYSIDTERLLGDFRCEGRGPQNRARITVKSTFWFALFSGLCLAFSTLAGQFLLFVKFRFFDLPSIQILVLRVSLSRHLRTHPMTRPKRWLMSAVVLSIFSLVEIGSLSCKNLTFWGMVDWTCSDIFSCPIYISVYIRIKMPCDSKDCCYRKLHNNHCDTKYKKGVESSKDGAPE